MSAFYKYSVFFQPLMNSDDMEYADEIDVSDRIVIDGIGNISKSIDAGDYDVGVFVFQDLTLKGYNFNGYFNENEDSRSIFKSTRDLCKVRVVFYRNDATRVSSGTITSEDELDTITYRGLINEEGTRLDVIKEEITFKVLSRDSVLRTTKVQGGVINTGDTTTAAMFAVLNTVDITSILTLDIANITPPISFTVDDGSQFDNKSVKQALDELLLATNSVLLIDDDGVITIKDRSEDQIIATLNLYGPYDEFGRENIIDITGYNTGKQRMFNSCRVNDQEASNSVFVESYGFRQKTLNFDWLTDSLKELTVAQTLVAEFKTPKIELSVRVATDLAKDVELLDPVSINFPYRAVPPAGTFLPVYSIATYGDVMTPYPNIFGSIKILPRVAFKVIGIEEDPKEFTTVLKLRQSGTEFEDGYFDMPGSSRYDFGVYGESVYQEGNACATFNPSVYGAAKYGCTRYE